MKYPRPVIGLYVRFTHKYEIDARANGGVVVDPGMVGKVVGFDVVGGRPGREVLVQLFGDERKRAFIDPFPKILKDECEYDAGVLPIDDLNGFHATTDLQLTAPWETFWSYCEPVTGVRKYPIPMGLLSLPEISDLSYGNDAADSVGFMLPTAHGHQPFRVWIDDPVVLGREYPNLSRFTLDSTDGDFCEVDDRIIHTNDEAELLKAIEACRGELIVEKNAVEAGAHASTLENLADGEWTDGLGEILRPIYEYLCSIAEKAPQKAVDDEILARAKRAEDALEDIALFINSSGHTAAKLVEKFKARAQEVLDAKEGK